MALTAVDKVKINKYLKEHASDNIYYLDMCDAIGKRDKISDVEFLDYFVETVVKNFQTSSKISVKQMTKFLIVVESFFSWVYEQGSNIKEETIEMMRSFGDFYIEYLNKNNLAKDEEFYTECIEPVLKKVNKLYPSNSKDEHVGKYVSKIVELEEQINRLNKSLSSVIKEKGQLSESYDQKIKRIEVLTKEISSLNNAIQTKEVQIETLNNSVSILNESINELESNLNSVQNENSSLLSFKTKYEELLNEVANLRRTLEDGEKQKKETQDIEVKQSNIEKLIYEKLLSERSSLDDVLSFVQEKGFVSSKEEVYSLLQNIKKIVNIDNSFFQTSPSYKIASPIVLEDGKFIVSVPRGSESIDLMLAADFHIKEFNNKTLNEFDMLNEYCSNHGINLILNLGDFYHGLCGRSLDYENAIKNYKIVEESIAMIPRLEGIYHAILGGNHDKNIVQYGFDPLEVLSSAREDFINLGYIHSTIELRGTNKIYGRLDVHHPDTFTLPMDLTDDIEEMNHYLNDIYDRQNRSRDDSYIDVFGHTHINRFNYPEGYYYLGPFKNGACHLRINFNDKEIENMVFMPLSATNKLVKNNEIIYQKILRK